MSGAQRHPLARGIDLRSPATFDAQHKAAQLGFLAQEAGLTLAQTAYRFVLSHPGVTTVLGGFSACNQLEELCDVSGAPPFDTDAFSRLDAVWRGNFDVAA